MQHYLKLVLLFITLGLTVFIALSYWVDPYGIYLNSSDAFPRKMAAADKGRTIKPYQVMHIAPYTLIVGNSRVELGMPFRHPFYQGKAVYNMGLPGASIAMQYAYSQHAIVQNDSVQQVVIALDFLDFTSDAKNIVTSVDNSRWSWRLLADNGPKKFADNKLFYTERISLLFSLTAIVDSIETIALQPNNINALNRFGFNDGKSYQFHVAAEGFGAIYQQKADELDSRLSKQHLVFSKNSYHIKTLDNFIQQLKQNNLSVFLLINPYQKPYLDKITQYRLDSHFLSWKQEMAAVAAKHHILLYDFAINSPLVNDVVAKQSRNAQDSPYFWEPAHYRPAFGNLILDALLTGNCHDLCHIYND
jgi:phage-related protein